MMHHEKLQIIDVIRDFSMRVHFSFFLTSSEMKIFSLGPFDIHSHIPGTLEDFPHTCYEQPISPEDPGFGIQELSPLRVFHSLHQRHSSHLT